MKNRSDGFTLLETIMATGILVVASTTIAALFLSSIKTNLNNQDRTVASLLLSDKLEQFSVLPPADPGWASGTYSENVFVGRDGAISTSPAGPTRSYLRSWQVSTTQPRTVTVVVYISRSAVTGAQTELIRATAVAEPRW